MGKELGRLGRGEGRTTLDPHLCLLPAPGLRADIIFNFEKAYFILDEFRWGRRPGHFQEECVLKAIEQADSIAGGTGPGYSEEEEEDRGRGHPTLDPSPVETPAAPFPPLPKRPFPVAFGPSCQVGQFGLKP